MKKKKQPSGVKKPTARQLVKRLEEQIAAARLHMENRKPGGGTGIANHILNLERQLAIAKSHIKSKFSSVNHSVVDGSFGSGKRR